MHANHTLLTLKSKRRVNTGLTSRGDPRLDPIASKRKKHCIKLHFPLDRHSGLITKRMLLQEAFNSVRNP